MQFYKPMQSLANHVLKLIKRNRGMVKSDKQLGKRFENKGVGENKQEVAKEAVQCSVWIRAWSSVQQAFVLVVGEAGG